MVSIVGLIFNYWVTPVGVTFDLLKHAGYALYISYTGFAISESWPAKSAGSEFLKYLATLHPI